MLPSGNEVDLSHTTPGNVADWARSRFAAALLEAKAAGETDDAIARDIALSVLTHWSIETANGAGEYNFNPGNINAFGSQDFVMVRDVDGTQHAQRTFDTITDGAHAYFQLLHSARYASAVSQLGNAPKQSDWYIALGKAGWFDPTKAGSTWDAARQAFETRRKSLEQYAEG